MYSGMGRLRKHGHRLHRSTTSGLLSDADSHTGTCTLRAFLVRRVQRPEIGSTGCYWRLREYFYPEEQNHDRCNGKFLLLELSTYVLSTGFDACGLHAEYMRRSRKRESTVTDATGATVAGAKVSSRARPWDRTTTETNTEGEYEVPALPPGSYEFKSRNRIRSPSGERRRSCSQPEHAPEFSLMSRCQASL